MSLRKSTKEQIPGETAGIMGEKEAKAYPEKEGSKKAGYIIGGLLVLLVFSMYPGNHDGLFGSGSKGPPEDVSAVTWNMAAINNNPFEYWITNDDPNYGKLMEDVSEFINNPGDNDVPVSSVFTPAMFEELCTAMTAAGFTGVDEVRTRWETEYKDRKIITEFIKDGTLGKKRLASMPDRYTNTIITADVPARTVTRPTVINCYDNDLGSVAKWWTAWKAFVFETEVVVKDRKGVVGTKKIKDMLSPIKNSKYPAISVEEEAISIPLQTMCGAIFDAILVHMMTVLAPDSWQGLRTGMCDKLNRKKNHRTVEILETTYKNADIQFLQEVAATFIDAASDRPLVNTYFDLYFPHAIDKDRNQNSLILLKKGLFTDVEEVTDRVIKMDAEAAVAASREPAPLSNGDLFVVFATRTTDNKKFLLASFHGDTNGLATIPVLTAVKNFAMKEASDRYMLFGMDANTYENPKDDQQGVTPFAQWYTSEKLNSCYGPTPNPKNYTTFHARTYLQPQLNKAIKYSEKDIKGDKNPKDFIVFWEKDYVIRSTTKDNTGSGVYTEGMVFPTLAFPSDHGITWTSLALKPAVTLGQPANLRRE